MDRNTVPQPSNAERERLTQRNALVARIAAERVIAEQRVLQAALKGAAPDMLIHGQYLRELVAAHTKELRTFDAQPLARSAP